MTLTNVEATLIGFAAAGAYAISVVGAYAIGEMTGRYRERWESTPEPEEDDVARRPLTDEQLKECFDGKGKVCPRCGDDEDLTEGDLEATDDGPLVEMKCEGCNEAWRLVYTLVRVERSEG